MSQECTFCGKQGVPSLQFNHFECKAEHDLRCEKNICSKCNKKPRDMINDSATLWCDTCKVTDDWKGYENCFKG